MKTILKNVNLLHPEQKINEKGKDILLIDGVISKIGGLSKEDSTDAKVFDFSGKYVVPGFLTCMCISANPEEKMRKQL